MSRFAGTTCGWLLALLGLGWSGISVAAQESSPATEKEAAAPIQAALPPRAAADDEPSAETAPEEEPATPNRFWFRAEYMLWLNKKAPIAAPLVTSGLNTDPKPGVLGAGGRVVFGNDAIDFHERHGGRFTLGYRFRDDPLWSVEAMYHFYGDRHEGFFADSPGSTPRFPVLSRPFFNVVTGVEDATVIAYPGVVAGSIDIRVGNYLYGGELLGARELRGGPLRVEALAGLRCLRLEEDLSIAQVANINPGAAMFAGRNIQVRDLFATENNFYGGEIGFRAALRWKRLDLESLFKISLGCTHSETTVAGSTTIDTVIPTSFNAGLLALASNSGQYDRTQFTALPEAGMRLALNLTDNWQVSAGYTFIYWDNVMRPGDQIDRRLNPRQIPTSALFGSSGGEQSPVFPNRDTDFWVHAFSFGIAVKY